MESTGYQRVRTNGPQEKEKPRRENPKAKIFSGCGHFRHFYGCRNLWDGQPCRPSTAGTRRASANVVYSTHLQTVPDAIRPKPLSQSRALDGHGVRFDGCAQKWSRRSYSSAGRRSWTKAFTRPSTVLFSSLI